MTPENKNEAIKEEIKRQEPEAFGERRPRRNSKNKYLIMASDMEISEDNSLLNSPNR